MFVSTREMVHVNPLRNQSISLRNSIHEMHAHNLRINVIMHVARNPVGTNDSSQSSAFISRTQECPLLPQRWLYQRIYSYTESVYLIPHYLPLHF